MSADAFVRPAREADAPGLAWIQVQSWRAWYADLVPAVVLDELTNIKAEDRWRGLWQSSIASPPTSRHRVLVAVETADGGSRTLAGFGSFGPATDPDRWPATDAELYELCVHPDYAGRGHGSRLLNAVAATVAEDGFQTLCIWILQSAAKLREFLESSGWAADGARRELDMGTPVPQIRLHVAVAG